VFAHIEAYTQRSQSPQIVENYIYIYDSFGNLKTMQQISVVYIEFEKTG
jgi:hypothetical protein